MAKVTVGANGRLTLPRFIREGAGLEQVAELEVCFTREGILLRRTEERDPDQWWFWTDEWQAKEREVDEARARGERGLFFGSSEELEAFFAARDRELDATYDECPPST